MSFQRYDTPVYLNQLQRYLPERIITNDDLVQWMGKSIRGSWIEKRTGIVERRWVEKNQSCRDLAVSVGKKVLEGASSSPLNLSHLILATISGDFITPPTAPFVQHELALSGIGAFDVGAACSGFVTGLHLASSLRGNTLLISADVRSKFLNPEDFASSCLFGDGAAACIVGEKLQSGTCFKVLASQLFSDGSVGDVISIPSGGSLSPAAWEEDRSRFYVKMKDGAELFLKAVEGMTEAGLHFLKNCGVSRDEIAWLVPHQANGFLIEALADRMEIPQSKVVKTISHTGNTSGSTVGIALSYLLETPLQNGDKILLLAAGGGGIAACALLEYHQ